MRMCIVSGRSERPHPSCMYDALVEDLPGLLLRRRTGSNMVVASETLMQTERSVCATEGRAGHTCPSPTARLRQAEDSSLPRSLLCLCPDAEVCVEADEMLFSWCHPVMLAQLSARDDQKPFIPRSS